MHLGSPLLNLPTCTTSSLTHAISVAFTFFCDITAFKFEADELSCHSFEANTLSFIQCSVSLTAFFFH